MSRSDEPTHRQFRVLDFIIGFRKSLGYSPSYKEISRYLKVTPNASVSFVRALERKRLVTTAKKIARGIVPTERGERIVNKKDCA